MLAKRVSVKCVDDDDDGTFISALLQIPVWPRLGDMTGYPTALFLRTTLYPEPCVIIHTEQDWKFVGIRDA